jgi:hypothetical protein
MRQLNLRPQSSIMSQLLQRRRYLPWGQPKKRNAQKQDWWRLSVYKAMLQTWVLKIIHETVSRCPRLSFKLWHLTSVEKETLTRQLLLNLKKSDLELKVQMVAPFRFQTWSQRQMERFHVLKSSRMKFLFVFGWNNSLWVLLPAILFSLALLGLMGFTVFLLMPDFCASSECWKWVVVVVLCRSQTWWGGGDMGQVCGLYQVDQSTVAVKEKFGKFSTVLSPGCHCVPWCCGVNVAGVLSLRIQQLDVQCETKSKVWCCFWQVWFC